MQRSAPLVFLASSVLVRARAPVEDPRYLLMNMQYHNIPLFKSAFEAAGRGAPAANPALAVGISTLFNLVNNDTNSGGPLLQGIQELLANTTASKVPIFLGIDGENWWSNSGLVNWWDPEAPGYSATNRYNVEWTAPDGATNDSSVLKVSWRNWGSQIRISPQQNFHSPAVMAAYKRQLRIVIPTVVKWYNALPDGDKYLLAGIKVGWEASIGWNAYYYPGGNEVVHNTNHSHDPCLCPPGKTPPCTSGTSGAACHLNKSAPGAAWGMQQLGYAAARSAGLTPSGPDGSLSRNDIASLVNMYLSNITAEVKSMGFPLDKLYTHLGGTMVDKTCNLADPSDCDKDTQTPHVPFSAGITGPDPLQSSYNATLSFGNCRLLAFYNWEPTQDEERNKLEQHLNENVRVGVRGDGPSLALMAARKMLEVWSPPDES